MQTNDPFEKWKRERASKHPRAGFADRTMLEIHHWENVVREREERKARTVTRRVLHSRPAQFALCSLAALALFVRIGSVLSLWYAQ